MKSNKKQAAIPAPEACKASLPSLTDAIFVIGGKWRLPIIISLAQGNRRFNEIQKAVGGISAKVLAHELKELELNGFLSRILADESTTLQQYELTDYSDTLKNVIESLSEWGVMHRNTLKKRQQ